MKKSLLPVQNKTILDSGWAIRSVNLPKIQNRLHDLLQLRPDFEQYIHHSPPVIINVEKN